PTANAASRRRCFAGRTSIERPSSATSSGPNTRTSIPDLLRRFWRSSAAAKRGASYTETKAARGILMLVTRLRKRRAKEEVVPYVLVQDVASTWEQYERVTAPTVEPVPQGLILHVAGPTADGFRIGRRLGEQGPVG